LKSLLTCLLILGLLPTAVCGSQLLTAQSSYHQKGNFAILVLHFDERTAYQLQVGDGGLSAQITLSNCRADVQAAAELTALKNALIRKVQMQEREQALVISLQFSAAAKLVLRETEDPYSLILDMTQIGKSKQQDRKSISPPATKVTPAPKKTPIQAPPPKSKERNRLAEAQEKPAQTQPPEALKAQKMASVYHQLGNKEAEVQQWESFFEAYKGSRTPLDSFPDALIFERGATSKDLEGIKSGATVEPAVRAPAKRSSLAVELLLGAIIAALGVVVLVMYLRQRELNRAIKALLESTEEPSPRRSAEAPEDRSGRPGMESGKTSEVSRPAEETAREVLALFQTGISIPAIAEKLNMGQDEVRLVLNLAREEKASVS